MRLDVDELLELVELAVHLEHGNLLAEEGVGAVEELDAGVGARELAAAGDPGDGGALVEEVGRVEVLDTLLHDHAHAQDLALVVVGDELRGEHLDDDVGVRLLGVDERVEVGLARLDGGLDGLQGVATLGHVALDLPGELHVVGDVEVDLEVEHLAHALIREGVEALEDQDVGGLDRLRGVHHAGDVVVDALLHGLTLLERLDLVVHEVCGSKGGTGRSVSSPSRRFAMNNPACHLAPRISPSVKTTGGGASCAARRGKNTVIRACVLRVRCAAPARSSGRIRPARGARH